MNLYMCNKSVFVVCLQSSPKQGHPAVSRQLVRSLSMPTSTPNNIKANISSLSPALSSTTNTPILSTPQKHSVDATSKAVAALVSPNIISAPKLSTLMSVTATGLPHNGGSNSRPPSQGSSQSLPSPKTVIANVNAAQFMGVTQLQSVVSTGDQPSSSPLTSSTPPSGLTTMDMKPSSPAFVGQPPVLQPVFNQGLPGMVNLTFPTAARGTATAGSRRTSGTSAPTSSTLQNLQTIVVKQEAGGKPKSSVATLPILATGTAASTMRSVGNVSKPMVARLVSGSQMVSLGSLVPASAGLVTSQPGMAPAGASTIHIQGNSFVRPLGAATQLNVLQTNQLATAGVKLNRLALMTQGTNATTTSLSPNVLISQPKLLSVTQGQLGLLQAAQLEAMNSATQVTPIPIATSHSSSPVKAANSSGPSSGVATSPLPGKPSQTLVMSPKGTNQFATGGTSVSLAQGSSLPSVIFATSSPGSSSAVVFACQGSLKTTQTYMMAAPGAPPAVIMATAAQQGIRGAAVTPLNVKALQGIKVIPMSQTVAPVKGCKGQPLFARIITPSGGIALHPTGTVTAGLGQQMTASAAVSIVQGLGPLPMQSSSSLVSQSCSPGKSTAITLPATISQPLVVQPTASSSDTPTTSS
ncbi:mucin-5AC-like [Limulus polyphemus]|uniref:Mucin-5AC-like n=1 Tax=Limulus polyphemus TaxID=6850 RepID=A0ABM1RXK1_LIMPO|nr:mucin-5AC-like [Limulus polyphemus]